MQHHSPAPFATGRSGAGDGTTIGTAPLAFDEASVLELSRELKGLDVEIWINAAGASMHPAIVGGSRVLLSFSAVPRLGDVVLFERDGRAILHRIVWRRGGTIVTRGDGCSSPEPPMAVTDIRAVALAVDDGRAVHPLVWAGRFGVRACLRGFVGRARALVRSRLPTGPS